MTENSEGILLNLVSTPIKKKKGKSSGNASALQSIPEALNTVKPKIRPKNITAPKTNPIKLTEPKQITPVQKPPSEVPAGILKNNDRTPPFQTVWKKFKKSNKSRNYNNSNEPITKPERLGLNEVKAKKNAEYFEPSFKKVSFRDEISKPELDSSVKISEIDGQNTGSFKNSFVKHRDNNFSTSEYENSDLAQVKGKKKVKKKVFEDELNNFPKFYNPDQSKQEHNKGKVTSLFHNNPEIPDIAHRAVKPVREVVFSELCFEDLNLHPYMVKNLKESMGLTKMTVVQEKSIPILLENKDALIRSQTGSGKTLAFALPLLHKLQEIRPKINRADGVLALIVLPTRELALQTYEVFNKLVKSYTWIVPGYLVGGEKRKSEKARLRKGITILIGTPGRLIDHVQHTKALSLEKVSWLILDEADRLLDLGYEKDVSVLLETLDRNDSSLLHPDYLSSKENETVKKSKSRQTILLSATLSAKVQKLAGLSMRDPVFVDACGKDLSSSNHVPVLSTDIGTETDTMVLPENLDQKYVVIPPKLKLVTLSSFILRTSKISQQKKMLVFLGTQDMVDYYAELLSSIFGTSKEDVPLSEGLSYFLNCGIELFKLHGNMKQSERTEVFKTFRESQFGVLLCTDVAARGLDLPEVDWVIQYTGPISVSDYVHRVGRTARGGQSGSSIIFLTPNEVNFIGKLENCQIRLQEEKMEACLNQLIAINPQGNSIEEEATRLQMALEKLVTENRKLYDLACKAYSSWSRFYASYPKNMRDAFSVKTVHQGHYAKSFALRDAPSVIINYARNKNLNGERFPRKRPREKSDLDKGGHKFMERSKISKFSEFDSGLEPLPKKKK